MFDYLDTVVGAVLAVVAYRVGRRSKRPYAPKRVEPICGCGHHRSFHRTDGPCGKRGVYLSPGHYGPCGCQNYVGPKPYSEVMDELEAEG